jgi:5-methylcytosine-specific restriction endonuclease McrA
MTMAVHALLLNASFEPIKVIPARRAVMLILSGKAETVEAGEGRPRWRSASDEVEVPAVLRLKYQVKVPYRATVPLSRAAVLARDNGMCQFTHCDKRGDTMDHVIPRARGGRHAWDNIVTACRKHNGQKGDSLIEDLGWTLKRKPFAPKAWFYVVFKFDVDPAWVPYLPAV